jgi:hypothetical protein
MRTFEVGEATAPTARAQHVATDGVSSAMPTDAERIELIRSHLREGLPIDVVIERVVDHELTSQFGPVASSPVTAEARAAIAEHFKSDPALHALIERVIVDAASR